MAVELGCKKQMAAFEWTMNNNIEIIAIKMYLYIYIYIKRERGREWERDLQLNGVYIISGTICQLYSERVQDDIGYTNLIRINSLNTTAIWMTTTQLNTTEYRWNNETMANDDDDHNGDMDTNNSTEQQYYWPLQVKCH